MNCRVIGVKMMEFINDVKVQHVCSASPQGCIPHQVLKTAPPLL